MTGSSSERPEQRGIWQRWVGEVPSDSDMKDQVATANEAESRSLDFVQRVVVSLLVLVAMGTVSAALAAYLVVGHTTIAPGDLTGLWLMSGVVGLLCTGTILLINRRRPYHPLLVVGLVPMLVSWYWVFGPGA